MILHKGRYKIRKYNTIKYYAIQYNTIHTIQYNTIQYIKYNDVRTVRYLGGCLFAHKLLVTIREAFFVSIMG